MTQPQNLAIPLKNQKRYTNSNPLVSILVITYNHENYIRESIQSFLEQETTFQVEIVIHNDASTDNTKKIIEEYEQKFPWLFNNIHQTENKRSTGIKPRYTLALQICRGKYIANCDGDDYWTDKKKLQKQIDFLENNLEVGLIHTEYDEYFQNTNTLEPNRHRRTKRVNAETNIDIFLNQLNFDMYHVRTVTVCMRKNICQKAFETIEPLTQLKLPLGDYPLMLQLSKLTKFKYFDESMAVHRILPESASHTKSWEKRRKFQHAVETIQDFFIEKYDVSDFHKDKIYKKRSSIFLKMAINENDPEFARSILHLKPYWTWNHKFKFFISQKQVRTSIYLGIRKSYPVIGLRFILRTIRKAYESH